MHAGRFFTGLSGRKCTVARISYVYAAIVLFGTMAAVGCQSKTSTSPSPTTKTTAAAQTPRDIVDRTINAYKQALAYSDDGQVRLSYKQDGQSLSDSAPLSVKYSLPNLLRVDAYQAEIACDGNKLHAIIRDESTASMDGQVVVKPAPKQWTLDELYADTVLRDTLQSGLGRHPVQLELLFGEAPLVDLVKQETSLKFLDAAKLEDQRCYRIEAALADGNYVFWIDEQQFLLRRIEYPAQALLPELAKAPGVTDLKIVADFTGAKFEKQLSASTFAFKLPAGAKQVHYFVLPPQGLPSQLFGKTPGEFKLTSTDGAALESKEFQGKLTALMWFTNDPACAWGLKQFSDALKTEAVKDKVNAFVIATEDRAVTNEQLAGVLKDWDIDVPLLRDFALAGQEIFQIKNAPTLVILDKDGRVQIFEEGVSPKLAQTLPVVLERLLAGDDLSAELLADARKSQEQYAQNVAIASGEQVQTAVVELPTATVADAREPQHFTRKLLWTSEDKALEEPGNLLAVSDKEQTRLYVVDGSRTVVEMGQDGKVLQKHRLDLPPTGGISYLRTAVNKDGKRWFVGSALLGKQLFVFDEAWQTSMRYPPDDQDHEGLHAVEIADLAGDGTPELYVGFWSLIGIQGVTLDGKREWTNRVVPTVLSIVSTPENELGWRKILVSGDRGYLYRLNQFGHQDPKLEVPNRQIHRMSAAEWTPSLMTTYCGVSYLADARLLAVGLNADLQEVWNYKLPVGQFNNQIQYLTAGRLRDPAQGEWVIAGPDGSVHIVSDDGEFSDSFAVGEILTGVAAATFGEHRVVLTATKSGVKAWKLEKK